MSKRTLIITSLIILASIAVTLLSYETSVAKRYYFKPDPPKEHEYIIKGTLQQFVFINNYLSKTQEVLTRTSSLPSNLLSPETDTINQIKNFLLVQVQSQFTAFQKEDLKQDSIDNAKKKK